MFGLTYTMYFAYAAGGCAVYGATSYVSYLSTNSNKRQKTEKSVATLSAALEMLPGREADAQANLTAAESELYATKDQLDALYLEQKKATADLEKTIKTQEENVGQKRKFLEDVQRENEIMHKAAETARTETAGSGGAGSSGAGGAGGKGAAGARGKAGAGAGGKGGKKKK